MRELDPFSFFINHASAIAGFGGDNQSPDPRYCFHTPYIPVRPGPARYELKLHGVRASRGELALRVHAFRPDTGENASLVAASRLDVATQGRQDTAVSVRFSALRDVNYAFYGYFIEDSDLHADGLTVLLDESEVDAEGFIEPPRSLLALEFAPKEVRPANALIHVVTPHVSSPVSQDCTVAQLSELGETPVHGSVNISTVSSWAEAVSLAALNTYGVTTPALEGLVIGPSSKPFDNALAQAGFLVCHEEILPPPSLASALFVDFLLCPSGLPSDVSPNEAWDIAQGWLRRLKIGGVAAMNLRYNPGADLARSSDEQDPALIGRNEISKWALRLIAEGYSVAPLSFAPPEDLALDADGRAQFALIVQRQ